MRFFIRSLRLRRNSAFCRVVTGVLAFGFAANLSANPTGMTVGHGSATLHQSGSQLTVTASQNAFLNWQSFNIAAGETTTFVQPSSTSIVWNRINDQNPSQIFGNLNANGIVVLLNSSGFYFGPNSFVSAAGLVVSTANCAPPENAGGSWEFNGPPPLMSIVNYGHIQVGNGGSAFLIADQVENHGTIEAPGGTIGLAAGQTVLLSERPDGRGMSMQVTLPQGSVDNSGNLLADAGTIALQAQVVNQNGIIQANSVQNQNGVIELVASDQLNLGANSQILARGDDSSPGSSGGNVTLQSGNNFSDTVGGQIITAGGTQGGNGGNIEVSAPNISSLNSAMDASAQSGWNGGEFFLDPVNIILGTSTAGGAINVNTAFTGFSTILLQATGNISLNAGTTWNLSSSTGLKAGQLTLEAGGNIIFNSSSAGVAKITDPNNWSVTLDAGYNFVNNTVQPGGGTASGNIFLNGGGGLTGGGLIQTGSGNVNLTAGQSITVGKGYVNTTGGGSITAHALAGNIDTGSFAQGYHFASGSYNTGSGLGGISTAAGGNVSLTAGGNVSSVLPTSQGQYYYNGNKITAANSDFATAGAGAYGHLPGQAGNVTIVAGGNVTGSYLVANGIGSIYAGVIMDANYNPKQDASGNYVVGNSGNAGTGATGGSLALNLISGGWNVNAQNIFLQEVRNPSGVFNTVSTGGAANSHRFDYAPGDYVNLTAANQVQLGGSASDMPRLDTVNVPAIYPPILNISAGAGGVVFNGDATYNELILYPSKQGSLTINTTQGGSLVNALSASGGIPPIFYLIVSDSGKSQFKVSGLNGDGDFGLKDHASTPVHLNNPTPIVLNISGDMSQVMLGAPEAAQINVGGNMDNSRFQGMNLSAKDTTSINVAGDIKNRGDFTTAVLDLSSDSSEQAPNLSYFSLAVDNIIKVGNEITDISQATLYATLSYNPATKTMIYQNIPGIPLASVLNLLQNLTVQLYINGVAQWADSPFNTIPVPDPNTVSVLNPDTANALLKAYNMGNVDNGLDTKYAIDHPLDPFSNPNPVLPPDGSQGYFIGGGGTFNISAGYIDLGTTAGIQSLGVGLYATLGSYPLASKAGIIRGADINLTTTGNLDMFSTSIASLNGGNISIDAGGDVNVGSSDFNVSSASTRGIYTSAQSDVTVIAKGDINVNGSRIAAYDGGNVTVESLDGNINAGTGGSGYVIVTGYYVDPATFTVYSDSPTIPGSGILATTFPMRDASYPAPAVTVGNILVETPNGNVNANAGGVIQLPLNDSPVKKNKKTSSPPPPDSSGAVAEVLAGYELHDSSGNAVLASSAEKPTISGSLSTAALTDPPYTVGIQNGSSLQKIQVTSTVWSELASLLNLSPGAGQIMDVNVSILDKTGLEALLLGTSGTFSDYNYAYLSSPARNIDASGSGVIAENAVLLATGDLKGVIFSKFNISIVSPGTVSVTALGKSIEADAGNFGPSVLIGTETVDTQGGGSVETFSQNANGGGSTFAQGTAADATSQAASAADAQTVASGSTDGSGDADDLKKKKGITLAQKVGRVTVLLPPKTLSENQTSKNPL